jgi:nucleoside 2-deoxyribosyltransferase
MKLEHLKKYDLIYVGTPYTKYPAGIHAAFVDACRLTARLLREGLKVYSPIAHTHPIAIHGEIDPLDLAVWLPFDAAIMDKSDAMIVGMLPDWERSTGVKHEIQAFVAAGKPVYFMSPDDLSYEPCSAKERAIFLEAARAA